MVVYGQQKLAAAKVVTPFADHWLFLQVVEASNSTR